MQKQLSTYLKRLGFSPSMKGYWYISYGLKLVHENPNLLLSITKRLYPEIASAFNTSAIGVEKGIRLSIEYAWLNADIDLCTEIFQYSIHIDKDRPTNRQFFITMAEYIRLEIIFNQEKF